MKKTILFLTALAVIGFAGQAQAATATKAATPQQNRMKTCAAEYHQKNIAKSQYRSFMSQCLKSKKASATKTK